MFSKGYVLKAFSYCQDVVEPLRSGLMEGSLVIEAILSERVLGPQLRPLPPSASWHQGSSTEGSGLLY